MHTYKKENVSSSLRIINFSRKKDLKENAREEQKEPMNKNQNVLELYEKKILTDEEFPIQMFLNQIRNKGKYFQVHWHEHIELHYVLNGVTRFYINQKTIEAGKGSLVVVNSNELHEGVSKTARMDACVIIFEMEAFSQELAHQNIIFQSLIEEDEEIKRLIPGIYQEYDQKQLGFKLSAKGMLFQLLAYLIRNYAVEVLSESANMKRKRNLDRLNTVVQYIQEHYTEQITNAQLAEAIHLSEDRFNHLFKESFGTSPLNYINEIRLKKAMHLLKKNEFTVSEAAIAVGFQDFNHFGRLFRKMYGCTPSSIRNQK